MMKTSFLLALIVFGFTSCKKTYTCVCSTVSTANGASGNLVTITKNLPYSEKMTSSGAKAACTHEQESIQSTEESFFSANGLQVDVATTCTLE